MGSLNTKPEVKLEEAEPKEEPPIIGIDLGTENCCVAWRNPDGRTEIIPNSRNNRTTPSYIAFTKNGRIFGEEAKEQAHLNPTNTVYDLKRLIGRQFSDRKIQDDIDKHWPFKVLDIDGQPRIEVEERSVKVNYSPEQITSFLVGYLKATANTHLGGVEIKKAVVSVPVYFNESQRQLTKNACKLAGLEVKLISEPLAAALACAERLRAERLRGETVFERLWERQYLFVFDLGGGTLDLSLNLSGVNGIVMLVCGSQGDTRLGGNDFDQRILYHFLRQLRENHDYDFEKDKAAMYLLTVESEKAKKHLSTNESYKNEGFEYKGVTTGLSITRAEFEYVCEDLFKRIEMRVSNFLKYGINSRIAYHILDKKFTEKLHMPPNESLLEALKAVKDFYLKFDEFGVYSQFLKKDFSNYSVKITCPFKKLLIHARFIYAMFCMDDEEDPSHWDWKLLEDTTEIIQKALCVNKENQDLFDAYNYAEAVDSVALVGGSSQIPKIKSLLGQIFGEYRSLEINPHEAVACGAARHAIRHHTCYLTPDFADSVSFSIGIENSSNEMDVFIERNSPLPLTVTKLYERMEVIRDHKGTPIITVKVYEGEEKMAKDNDFRGLLQCEVTVPIKIEISIHVDWEKIIKLTIKNVSSGKVTSKILSTGDDKVREAEVEKFKSDESIRRLLDTEHFLFDSTKPKMNYRRLENIFKENLIEPIAASIVKQLKELEKEEDLVDVSEIQFEFPFDGCNSEQVKQLKLLKVFKSQAKPKQLECYPMNRKIIYKEGDNLHDDQICMAFLNVFNAIWKHHKVKFEWKVISIQIF